jgi:hypothetical protein
VLRVETTGPALAVYNLAVEGVHEYFANGILVANCSDSSLYAWRHMSNWLARPDVGPQTADEALAAESRKHVDQLEDLAKQRAAEMAWNPDEWRY